MMMTQNEAPDPPNEDPTYERYQSSEQRGKQFAILKSSFLFHLHLVALSNYIPRVKFHILKLNQNIDSLQAL